MDIFKNVLKRKPELLSIKLFLYYFSRLYNLNIYTLVMVRNKNTQFYGFLKQNIHKWNQNRISSFKHRNSSFKHKVQFCLKVLILLKRCRFCLKGVVFALLSKIPLW